MGSHDRKEIENGKTDIQGNGHRFFLTFFHSDSDKIRIKFRAAEKLKMCPAPEMHRMFIDRLWGDEGRTNRYAAAAAATSPADITLFCAILILHDRLRPVQPET